MKVIDLTNSHNLGDGVLEIENSEESLLELVMKQQSQVVVVEVPDEHSDEDFDLDVLEKFVEDDNEEDGSWLALPTTGDLEQLVLGIQHSEQQPTKSDQNQL